MADKTIKLSSAADRNPGYIDAGTECSEDFSMVTTAFFFEMRRHIK